MELSVKITATQLTKREEIFVDEKRVKETFLGHEVKQPYENPSCYIPVNGQHLEVKEGYWLVEFPDGKKEVWSNEQIEAYATPTDITTDPIGLTITEPEQSQEHDLAEDVRIDDDIQPEAEVITEEPTETQPEIQPEPTEDTPSTQPE